MLNLRGTLMTLFGDHLRLESQLVAYLALVALSQLLQPLPPLALQLRYSLINWTLSCILYTYNNSNKQHYQPPSVLTQRFYISNI